MKQLKKKAACGKNVKKKKMLLLHLGKNIVEVLCEAKSTFNPLEEKF